MLSEDDFLKIKKVVQGKEIMESKYGIKITVKDYHFIRCLTRRERREWLLTRKKAK